MTGPSVQSRSQVVYRMLKRLLDFHVTLHSAMGVGLFDDLAPDAEVWLRVERLRDLCDTVLARRPTQPSDFTEGASSGIGVWAGRTEHTHPLLPSSHHRVDGSVR